MRTQESTALSRDTQSGHRSESLTPRVYHTGSQIALPGLPVPTLSMLPNFEDRSVSELKALLHAAEVAYCGFVADGTSGYVAQVIAQNFVLRMESAGVCR